MLSVHGVPLRVGGNTATRKSGETKLKELADAGLLVIGRPGRTKFAFVKLTDRGEARSRALCGLPDRAAGRAMLLQIAGMTKRDAKFHQEAWANENALNAGRGWGDEHGEELARLAERILPAISAGWVVAHGTMLGHARYRVTPGGWEEIDRPSTPPDVGPLPPVLNGAINLYDDVLDERLEELKRSEPEVTGAIGNTPLPVAHWNIPLDPPLPVPT
jgi:hypothetical protein